MARRAPDRARPVLRAPLLKIMFVSVLVCFLLYDVLASFQQPPASTGSRTRSTSTTTSMTADRALQQTSTGAACGSVAACPAGSTCIEIVKSPTNMVQKCALNPVCQKNSVGHCPSYQPSSAVGGELYTQCIFVNTTKLKNVKCCDDTGDGDAGGSLTDADCFECYHTDNDEYYAGHFHCHPVDQCASKSEFPNACAPDNDCRDEHATLCNQHGTCTPLDIDDPQTTYGCVCDSGFEGGQCEKATSNACLVDCGVGGTCEAQNCECRVGWAELQCLSCTRNASCNSAQKGGVCDVKTGECSCNAGFKGQDCADNASLDDESQIDQNRVCAGGCGQHGQCVTGECVCSQCIGTFCAACDTPLCDNCNGVGRISPSTMMMLILVVLVLILS